MSRTKILATTALVALGTSCLVATEGSARTAASFAHSSGGHATSSHAATISHTASVSRPTNIPRPVSPTRVPSIRPSTTLSHGLTQFIPSNTASHGLTHLVATNTTIKSGTVPTLNGHQANKIVPSPTSNAGMITVLTNQAAADDKAAKTAAATAKQDRETAKVDTRIAKNLQAVADAAAKRAASEAQTDPAKAQADRLEALNLSLKASTDQIKARAASLDAARQQAQAKVLTNNAKAEAAAANKLANGTVGNGTTGTQQGNSQAGGQTNGQGGGQTNGQGGGQTNGQGGVQTNGQGGGQANTFPGHGGGFPGHGGGFPGHGGGFPGNGGGFPVNGGGVAPSNAGIASGAPTGGNAFPQTTASGYSNSPVAQNASATPQNAPLKAISLVWNADGRWVVRSGAALDVANANALNACNSQFGNCMASGATVDTTAPGCLGVAVSATDDHQLFAAMGASLDEVRASLMQQLTSAGVTGQVKYSACNA